MKVTEELIDQVLEHGESGGLDPTPYMENLKFLIMEDEEIEMTEEDHAYLIFLGTICLECLDRQGLYREIQDEEMLYDLEDANWEALEQADGDLDKFLGSISAEFAERELLEFIAYSVLPADDDDEEEEPVMSSEDAQVLGFVRLKGLLDAILMPVI